MKNYSDDDPASSKTIVRDLRVPCIRFSGRQCTAGAGGLMAVPGKAILALRAIVLRLFFASVFLLANLGAQADAQKPLIVERGDVVAISVVEEPAFDREAKVDASGQIALPRLGGIAAAGLTLDQVRSAIEAELREKDIVRAPTVTVDFAAYRPIYVDGTVGRPGAVAYEPGLTVRKALVLAGGLDREAGAGGLGTKEILELNSQWRANSFALLEVHSRIARLAAELAGRESPDSTSIEGIAAAPEAASDVLALDAALLKDNIKATRREKEHVNDLLDLTEFLLGVLGDQAEFQEKERELQHTELVNARDLADRGVIPLPRLRELEREEARLARDILEVKAFTARARQEKENLAFELDAADRKRSVDLQEKVRDAVLERTNLELEADLLSSQILAAGMAAAGPEGLSSPEARFLLHRVVEDGEQSIDADMSMEVLPGDVLEVTFEEGSLG